MKKTEVKKVAKDFKKISKKDALDKKGGCPTGARCPISGGRNGGQPK
jgi:hypothetical protein